MSAVERSLCECGHAGGRHAAGSVVYGACALCECTAFVDGDPRRDAAPADVVTAVRMALAMLGVAPAERVVRLVEWIVERAARDGDDVRATRMLVGAVIVEDEGDETTGRASA